MRVLVEYLGAAAEPTDADGQDAEELRVDPGFRESIEAAVVAAATQWNEQGGNTLLGGSNEIEHYRLTVDFAVREPASPVEVV